MMITSQNRNYLLSFLAAFLVVATAAIFIEPGRTLSSVPRFFEHFTAAGTLVGFVLGGFALHQILPKLSSRMERLVAWCACVGLILLCTIVAEMFAWEPVKYRALTDEEISEMGLEF